MSDEADAPTPYALMGGDPAIHAVVHRFYDLMDQDPAYAALRHMHAQDLGPMREKLCDWFSEWLGGPRRYHARPDAACIGAAHAPYAIDAQMRDQWLACMRRAFDDCAIGAAARERINPAMVGMAEFLRNR